MDGWMNGKLYLWTLSWYHSSFLGSGIFINVGRTIIINSTTNLPSPVFDMLNRKSRCIKEDTSSFCNNKYLCTGTELMMVMMISDDCNNDDDRDNFTLQ